MNEIIPPELDLLEIRSRIPRKLATELNRLAEGHFRSFSGEVAAAIAHWVERQQREAMP
jgi:predicted transcriptional regulator